MALLLIALFTMDEQILITVLKEKDEKAFNYLYAHYSANLFGAISFIIKDDHIAEDILQTTFMKIWANFDQYDPGKSRLFTWMLTIARNSAIDYRRSKTAGCMKYMDAPEDSKCSINPQYESIGIKGHLHSLDANYRIVFERVYFDGFSLREVAEYYNIPIGTVKTRLRRSITLLRKELRIACC